MSRPRAVLAVAVTGLLLSACAADSEEQQAQPRGGQSAAPSTSASPEPEVAVAVDPASVGANELGRVPVMMYHKLMDETCTACVYDQTPEEFRDELQRMYDADFRPITAAQLISGEFDVPAGKRPVVLTFDDSDKSHIQIGSDGEPLPDSAVGIMEAFEADNPDWKSTASLYVNSTSFGDEKGVPWLVENGYEVGVHTMDHVNLKQSSEAEIQEQIGGNIDEIKEIAPDATMTTMAKPFGIAPTNTALLESGSYEGGSYELVGVLDVGSDPSVSPYSADFDPYSINRIRSGPKDRPVEADSTFWLDLLEEGQWTPFVSDGDPEKVSFPEDTSVEIGPDWQDKAQPYAADGGDESAPESSPANSSEESDEESSAAPSAAATEATEE